MLKYLATPLVREGWNNTLVNDANGDTLMLMVNGGKRHGSDALAAVQEATALFSAAPEMLEALETAEQAVEYGAALSALSHDGTRITPEHMAELERLQQVARVQRMAAIAKARAA